MADLEVLWFVSLVVSPSLADTVLTALGGGVFEPPLYLPIALDFVEHEVLGVFVESRRFHGVLATGVLGIGLTWSPVAG